MTYGITLSQFKLGFWNGYRKITNIFVLGYILWEQKRISSFSNFISQVVVIEITSFSISHVNMRLGKKRPAIRHKSYFFSFRSYAINATSRLLVTFFKNFMKDKELRFKERSSFAVYSKELVHEKPNTASLTSRDNRRESQNQLVTKTYWLGSNNDPKLSCKKWSQKNKRFSRHFMSKNRAIWLVQKILVPKLANNWFNLLLFRMSTHM